MTTEDVSVWTGQEIAFGNFRFNPEQHLLLCGGTQVNLGSRAREILLLLVEHAGETVTKGDLMARVWPHVVVEEGTLRVHIAALRKALGDGRDGLRYIENVSGHGYRFIAPVKRLDTPCLSPLDADQAADFHYGVPVPPTRIIGRASAVAALAGNLPNRRFVTIVGPGGIGKTTVAIAAAERLRASYPDGVRFVELASVTDPSLLAGTVASALGLTTASDDPLPSIARLLKQKQMLIVLDNCEQVVEAAALLAEELLTRAAGLSVIATGREALGARGEWVLRLAPLDLPPRGAMLTAAEARNFSAIELFIERATAASLDGFELSDADAAMVTDICRKLDGVPLAIELAAARVSLLGVHGLASRLDDQLGLLAVGCRTAVARHRTLRATLDWSHELLPPPEQMALRRLAVFSGAFDLPAAIAVVADDQINAAVVAELLAELAAKSLVTVHVTGNEVFYRFLETTRAYAREKLEESCESAWIKRRHAQLCCSWGDGDLDAEPRSLGRWTAANSQRLDDVRAALDWCWSPNGDPLLGASLTASSAPIWFQSSFVNEYRRRLESALKHVKIAGTSETALELRLNVALGSATLFATGPTPAATSAFNEALELAERLGATVHHRRALWGLWIGRISAGDYLSALGLAETFCLLAHNSNDPGGMVAGDRMMALAHHFRGNQIAARRHFERALMWPSRPVAPLSEVLQIEHRIAIQADCARILWLQGFADQAVRMGRESLESAQSSGHSLSLCYALTSLCGVVLRIGDLLETERLLGMLLDHSSRHSLAYWNFWGRCFQLALGCIKGDSTPSLALLSDPLCTAVQKESLATLHESLVTREAVGRAENGLAGWCVAEILRVKAERLLRGSRASTAAAEGLLLRCLGIAQEQGALSWQLRTAMSLARLWHARRRTSEAHDLLASVLTRFTEGFESIDLVKARALLEDMVGHRPHFQLLTDFN